MSVELSYKCDVCGKHLGDTSPTRGGTVSGDDVAYVNPIGYSWHACSDTCLVRLFESWIAKVKARVGEKLRAEKTARSEERGW